MNKDVMFSSNKNDWETPQWLFDKLDKEFHFEIDVCADEKNNKCVNYIDIRTNALKFHWKKINRNPTICWMNPPYGRKIGGWLKKAYEESLQGCVVVCLIPARTDTIYWHKYCTRAYEIRFLKGRLKFVGAPHAAPFPSAIIVFRNKHFMDNGSLLPEHSYVDYRS